MTDEPTYIQLYGVATDSIVDGPGLRYTVFTQGCPHACPGCHNPESQIEGGGYRKPIEELAGEIKANKLITGVTFSGGEPLMQSEACLVLAKLLKQEDFNLWVYTGFLYEDIMNGSRGQAAKDLLALCDILVDGPFIENLHTYDLKWKGSTNQRVIDLHRTKEQGRLALWEIPEEHQEVPFPW